jgi:hypothetical protein
MVVIYHRNTPLPKVRKGLDGYSVMSGTDGCGNGDEGRPT